MANDTESQHRHDVERSVIGGMLAAHERETPGLAAEALSLLTAEDFASAEHRVVWEAIVAVGADGGTLDELSIVGKITERDDEWPGVSEVAPRELHSLGPIAYLAALSAVGTPQSVARYGRYLRELRGRSELAAIGSRLAFTASSEPYADRVAAEVERIQGLIAYSASAPMQTPTEAVAAYMRSVTAEHAGVPYGWPSLDAKIEPMRPGDFIMVAGRPSMGKSVFAGCVAANALERGLRVAVFSLEMATAVFVARWVAARQGLWLSEAMRPKTPEAMARVEGALAAMTSRWDFRICDIAGLSVGQMASRIRQEHAKAPFALAVIDYLQLMTPVDRKVSREQQVASISSALKNLARSLAIPLLCVCQLNRGPESRSGVDRRPRLADFRESGSIEQDIDTAIMLYREAYYDTAADPEEAEILVRKQRNGQPFELTMRFQGQFARFIE